MIMQTPINFREILLSFLNEVENNTMVSTYGSGPGPVMVLRSALYHYI